MSALHPLATDKVSRLAEYRRRSVSFVTKTVSPGHVGPLVSEGWTVKRELKTGIQLILKKSHDEILENKLWAVLYHMGYDDLNVGRKFVIEVIDHEGKKINKQIDVFGKDSNTVVVAECKSSLTMTQRSLQKDLAEFFHNRNAISNAIKKHYGRD